MIEIVVGAIVIIMVIVVISILATIFEDLTAHAIVFILIFMCVAWAVGKVILGVFK